MSNQSTTRNARLRAARGTGNDPEAACTRLTALTAVARFLLRYSWRSWKGASMSRFSLPVAVTTCQDAAAVPPPDAHFAILEVRVPRTFHPMHGRHVPSLCACWLKHGQARDLAITLNADVLKRGASGPWHVLVCTGKANSYGVLRVDCPTGLPDEPWQMPKPLANLTECHTGYKMDALQSCDQTNAAILSIARRPSCWNVCIRALTDATAEEQPTDANVHLPGEPGEPGPTGPVRSHWQDIPDWGQPAKWQTQGLQPMTSGDFASQPARKG